MTRRGGCTRTHALYERYIAGALPWTPDGCLPRVVGIAGHGGVWWRGVRTCRCRRDRVRPSSAESALHQARAFPRRPGARFLRARTPTRVYIIHVDRHSHTPFFPRRASSSSSPLYFLPLFLLRPSRVSARPRRPSQRCACPKRRTYFQGFSLQAADARAVTTRIRIHTRTPTV